MSNALRSKVALVKSTYSHAEESIDKILTLLDYMPRKEHVFIKPNLVDSYPPDSGIITSPRLVEAIILYFKKHYPQMEIVIGEGAAIQSINFDHVIQVSGYSYLSEKYGVTIINLDDVERKEFKWKYGTITLPSLISTHEYINVPKMKTHGQTLVSLGMKNQKGLLLKADKKRFHGTYDLNDSIYQLGTIAIPDLTIIDGILSLEGDGPIKPGKPKKTNILIGSMNMYAADNVAIQTMGFNPSDVEHVPGYDEYEVVGEALSDVMTLFKRPTLSPRKIFNIYFHYNNSMCSLCMVALMDAFFKNPFYLVKIFLAGGFFRRVDILLGNFEKLPDISKNAICIGNCPSKQVDTKDIYTIKGCPPKPENLRHQYLSFIKRK